jgi:hypothetical protein
MNLVTLVGLVFAGVVGIVLMRIRHRRRRQQALRSEHPEHGCPPGSFKVMLASHDLSVKNQETPLTVFDGWFCTACGHDLVCVECDETPDAGAIMAAPDLRAEACCPKPEYRLRGSDRRLVKGAITRAMFN